MRNKDMSGWKRQIKNLRLEDEIQGRLQKGKPARGGRKFLWLFMTDTNKLKDISMVS